MGQITRLREYETTRPPLSLLNVSKGFHSLLKSALVPLKQPPTHYSKMEPDFWTVAFCIFRIPLCGACGALCSAEVPAESTLQSLLCSALWCPDPPQDEVGFGMKSNFGTLFPPPNN